MRRILLTVLLLSVLTAAAMAVYVLNELMVSPREAYASDWTAAFIIEHIRTSDVWPSKWEDLKDEYDRLAAPEHYAWTFQELQTLVSINWDTSVAAIQESATPPDNVQLTSGRNVSYNGDPDVLVYEFVHTGKIPYSFR